MNQHLKNYWTIYLSLLLILSLLVFYLVSDDFRTFGNEAWDILWSDDREAILKWFKQFGVWGPLLIIFLMVLQMFLIVFPSWLPMVVAVMGYGMFWGIVISVAANFAASTIGYFIGRQLSTKSEKLIGEKQSVKLAGFLKKYGFSGVVLFRISPFLSSDAISFVAGIGKMGYWRYIAATMTGIIPLAVAIGYFGQDLQTLEKGLYWIGGFGIITYVLYIWLKK